MDFHERAELYLRGELSDEETKIFETLLDENHDLKKEFNIISEISQHFTGENDPANLPNNEYTDRLRAIIRKKDSQDFLKKLDEVGSTNKRRKTIRMWSVRVAASVLVLLMFGVGLYLNPDRSTQDLYVKYYNTSDLPSVTSRDTEYTVLTKGIEEFQEGNFEKSLDFLLEADLDQNTLRVQYLMYIGMAQLESGNLEEAIKNFDAVIESDSIDQSKGYWFKALAYLKAKDKDRAKSTLQLIVDNPGYFNHQKAKDLIDQL